MKFSDFSKYLHRLERTSGRLEMIGILTELISNLDQEEIRDAIYLTSGYLKAPYEGVKFNMADKMMLRVLKDTYSTKDKQYTLDELSRLYKEAGDMGDTAYELSVKEKDAGLSILDVHKMLMEVANLEGAGSQEAKVSKLASLLKKLDKLSSKYVVRIVLGTTRLGFTETTIIDSLANFLGNRNLKKEIEHNYNIHPDIGLVAKIVKTRGLSGLDQLKIELGIPVLSQKAQRVGGFMEETMKRIGKVWAEYKFDGTRVQLHLDKAKKQPNKKGGQNGFFNGVDSPYLIKTFTRNLEETTHQYPDIVSAAKKYVNADSVILDGEAIGFDEETGYFLPFQETMQRKRKHGIKETAAEIPLKYYVFDILYLNGASLINKNLTERREKLEKSIKGNSIIQIAEHIETTELNKLVEYYEKAKESDLEGLIAKNPEDPYQAGARSYSWIKLKTADEKLLDDAVECVVLGYYFGKGVRNKFGIGGFLVGVYDEKNDSFKTVSKIGTGLKEDDWIKMKLLCDKAAVNDEPKNVAMNKIFKPDVYTKPEIVVEIGADEISKSPTHTAGYALRFPRLLRFRPDKPAYETTSLTEIKDMFSHQRNSKK